MEPGERCSDTVMAFVTQADALLSGVVTIPKSTKAHHMKQNLEVHVECQSPAVSDQLIRMWQVFDFQLRHEHVEEMDTWHQNLRVTWDPSGVM